MWAACGFCNCEVTELPDFTNLFRVARLAVLDFKGMFTYIGL
jgi:hypothetical protein